MQTFAAFSRAKWTKDSRSEPGRTTERLSKGPATAVPVSFRRAELPRARRQEPDLRREVRPQARLVVQAPIAKLLERPILAGYGSTEGPVYKTLDTQP